MEGFGMMGRFAAASVVTVMLVSIGCGGGGGTCTPTTTDISGIWEGAITQDDVARGNPGTISATITQTQCTLGGTWKFSFGDAQLDKTFTIFGSAPTTTAVDIDLRECTGLSGSCDTTAQCDFVISGTLLSPAEISGTFTTGQNCSESETGSFDITLRARITPTPVTTPTVLATFVIPTAAPTPTPTP
jgi:hypothetical protein